MRSAVILFVLAIVTCGVFAGCGGDSAEPPRKQAKQIQKPAPPYDTDQVVCPVCGRGIDKDYHADVRTPKGRRRFYFDKPECIEKFKRHPSKYWLRYDNRFMSLQAGGST